MENQTLSEADIQTLLKDYIMGNFDLETHQEFDPNDNLLENGILDSLGIAEITEYMEATFNFEIDEDEMVVDNYRSIDTLTTFCQNKIANATAKLRKNTAIN